MSISNQKDNKMIYAVLTGDIIQSSSLDLPRREYLYNALQELSILLQKVYPVYIVQEMAKYRGDGWQLLINAPQKAFEISLFIRTYLRFTLKPEQLDSRIAIAIGKVDFIPDENISEGFGRAYTDSGKLLDDLTSHRLGFVLAGLGDVRTNQLIAGLIHVYDKLITSWTPAQCQAVHLSLQYTTQKEIGEHWQPKSVTQVAIAHHLKAANWNVVKEGLQLFEEVILSMCLENGGETGT